MNILVKAFESYLSTDRQTRLKLHTTPLRGWSINAYRVCRTQYV